jgi:hypothetical protein
MENLPSLILGCTFVYIGLHMIAKRRRQAYRFREVGQSRDWLHMLTVKRLEVGVVIVGVLFLVYGIVTMVRGMGR